MNDIEKNYIEDEWDDTEFGREFIKFADADITDSQLYDDNVEVLYVKPVYNSIKPYVNQWNKTRKYIQVYPILRAINTPRTSDTILNHELLYLDMGARLFKAMKIAYEHKWECIKILKTSNPNDKFDTHYYTNEYKLLLQKKIAPKKKGVKKPEK